MGLRGLDPDPTDCHYYCQSNCSRGGVTVHACYVGLNIKGSGYPTV